MGNKSDSAKPVAKAIPAWKAFRPHTFPFHNEAHSLVCNLRLDAVEAKKYCPDIDIGLDTNADDIMMAMFRKLQGVLTPVRDTPIEKGTRTEKGASLFFVLQLQGLPSTYSAFRSALPCVAVPRSSLAVHVNSATRP